MDIQVFLKILEQFELTVARHYRRLADGYAADREAQFVFHKMYLEEKAHASLIQFERRLIKNNPGLFRAATVDQADLESLTATVNASLERPQLQKLDEAVRLAAEIESSASEYHYRNALAEANPEVGRLLRGLGTADKDHAGTLWEFGIQRGYLREEDVPAFLKREKSARSGAEGVAVPPGFERDPESPKMARGDTGPIE